MSGPAAISVGRRRAKALSMGLVAAVMFVLLSGINLTEQGLYYDEIHQAPAAFTWLGEDPAQFVKMEISGVPVLDVTYVGTIKSHLYGLYMKCTHHGFSVRSWRMTGIAIAACGILLFSVVAGGALPPGALALFLLMLVTDATVLLTSRHDWGPTALSLFLRLAFVAIWLDRETGKGGIARRNALMGVIVGVAIYDKLSAAALLPALITLSLVSVRPLTRRDRLASAAGLAIGLIPLMIINLWSLTHGRGLISLTALAQPAESTSIAGAARYVFRWLSLGQGRIVGEWILGSASAGRAVAIIEALFLAAALLASILLARARKANPHFRTAAVMTACYASVLVGVSLLPRTTWVHHWILGTPFQYAAVALLATGLMRPSPDKAQSRRAWMATIAVAALILVVRLPSLIGTERRILNGNSSIIYDPSFTRIGEFAAARGEDAVFVAADWGVATQIYCLSNGRPGLVVEPFWEEDAAAAVRDILADGRYRTAYLVTRRVRVPIFPERTSAVVAAVERAADWRETDVEAETADLDVVDLRKFERVEGAR
jgi:hypothetical protein